jgi:transketolase
VIAGDGCLMEGISQEAISPAGCLKHNKLIVFWDDDHDRRQGIARRFQRPACPLPRFQRHTIAVDGHDPEAIVAAIEEAHKSDKPTMIACKTVIGFGAPNKAGTDGVHGSPLGAEEIAATRVLHWARRPSSLRPVSTIETSSTTCASSLTGERKRCSLSDKWRTHS